MASDAPALSLTDPFAHATGINSVIPKFILQFGYNSVGPGKLQLLAVYIHPFYRSFEALPAGGCVRCTGGGQFRHVRIQGLRYSETVGGGKIFVTRRTAFVQALTSPGEIGRFKVLGVSVSLPAVPVLLASGCTPANLALSNEEVLHWKTLPTVPCSATVPRGDHIAVSTPLELSSTQALQGSVTGFASGTQWLIAFEGQRYQSCALNALAESLRTQTFFETRVSGSFRVNFTTAPATTPGYTCAYLQTGGRVTVRGGLRLPYGRVAATASRPFLAGDTVGFSGATTGTAGQPISENIVGNASIKEQLYFFAPYSPCAGTAEAEYGVDSNVFTVPEKLGHFSTPLTINISPLSPSVVYECAYLQLGSPSNGVPTGPTLAAATGQISITRSATSTSSAHATASSIHLARPAASTHLGPLRRPASP